MRRDQVGVHVARMTGGVTQPLDAAERGEQAEQSRQGPWLPVRPLAMIGIHVLADEGDLAHAGIGQSLDLGADFGDRTGGFRAARIRHDTKRAELVAAFLHRDESGDAARAGRRRARRREMLEFVVDREFGVDGFAVAFGAREEFGQAVIVLRPDHEIDRRRPPYDLRAFGLRHAAGNRNENAPALGRCRFLQSAHAADLGIDLFRRFLAYVAGIENDEIGVLGRRGLDITVRRQGVRHTL